MYYPFPARYRYARDLMPAQVHPLSLDEVVARLREHLFYEAHNHRFYRAKSLALEAEVADLRASLADLRARLDALGADPGAVPSAA